MGCRATPRLGGREPGRHLRGVLGLQLSDSLAADRGSARGRAGSDALSASAADGSAGREDRSGGSREHGVQMSLSTRMR